LMASGPVDHRTVGSTPLVDQERRLKEIREGAAA